MNFEHVYQRYSVLPELNKVDHDNIFVTDEQRDDYLAEKRASLQSQQCVFEHEITSEIYDVVCKYILAHANRKLQPGSFTDLAMQLQEDLVIHRRVGDRDWFAAAHICFPSSWDPAEKIGRSFKEIHEPVPGMNLGSSLQLVTAMIDHSPYERFVWSVMHEKRLNNHPSIPRKPFDPLQPVVLVKIERQILVGFPEVQAVLFVLRQHYVEVPNKNLLFRAVLNMSAKERTYKGISQSFIDWIEQQNIENHDNTVHT